MVDDYFHHDAFLARASATSVETSNIVCALQRFAAVLRKRSAGSAR